MGKQKYPPIESGMKFGELTVIEEDFKKQEIMFSKNHTKRQYYKCLCSCGKVTTVQRECLNRGTTKSCGHLKKYVFNPEPKDLSEKSFNDLDVLYIDDTKPSGCGKHTYWICQCRKCGKSRSIRSSDLINGTAKDCGCGKSERASNGRFRDLSNKTFGNLEVIERDISNKKAGFHTMWKCKCTLCGRTESVSSAMLLQYGKDRCRVCAGVSMGEKKILDLLEQNNISFIHDKPYLDCKIPDTGGTPRFDFRINQNSDCDYIIEFDGEQHFKQVPMYDSSLSFTDRIKRDIFKNDWCKAHNIPIIRIPYTRLKKLCIEDLQLNSTNYLVK